MKEVTDMTVNKVQKDSKLVMEVEGRLDTTTASQLEAEIKSSLSGITELEFDFSKLEYISSAGLRVLLSAQKIMNKQGSMVVFGANEDLMEIFDVTGFIDILTIK
jgi:anti-sigma B factor antagonist